MTENDRDINTFKTVKNQKIRTSRVEEPKDWYVSITNQDSARNATDIVNIIVDTASKFAKMTDKLKKLSGDMV